MFDLTDDFTFEPDEDISPFRRAMGIYVLLLHLALEATYDYALRAVKQGFALGKTLVVLALVYGLYLGLSRIYYHAIEVAVGRIVHELTKRGDLDERLSTAVGYVVLLGIFAGLAALFVWAVYPFAKPVTERAPDPRQTSASEYLSDTADDGDNGGRSPEDVPDGSMAEDLLEAVADDE